MGRDVCGICWCPYDEEGKCGCENVKVINPAPTKVMWGTCIRCGKPFRSVDDIHTCSLPKALALADFLVSKYDLFPKSEQMQAAAELRRLHADNEQLAEFVIAVGGFWGHSRSKLVGEDSLAECINRGDTDESLLRQALEALDAYSWEQVSAASAAIKERLK
jgi:hypothetical protein